VPANLPLCSVDLLRVDSTTSLLRTIVIAVIVIAIRLTDIKQIQGPLSPVNSNDLPIFPIRYPGTNAG
jgi:hypothetical protein